MIARRPRRLRRTPALRELVAETSLRPSQLILPVFVREGAIEPIAISSMPGVVQHSRATLLAAANEAAELGLGGLMLFGVPEVKDAEASGAVDPEGILNQALGWVKAEVGDAISVMADTCADEFTDHGHCGILVRANASDRNHAKQASGLVTRAKASGSQSAIENRGILVRTKGSASQPAIEIGGDSWPAEASEVVDNDASLELYARMAVAQANAGADVVAPSGMMDGQVGVIREALDSAGHEDVVILAYSAKYASAFYGPFREAVDSSLVGDRRTYQQDPRNGREGVLEALLDVEQGADIVMVKPALGYLDVISQVRAAVDVPVAAYNVSGEYAMVEAAAAQGWIDRDAAIVETLTSIRRAGADIVLTYWAAQAARLLA